MKQITTENELKKILNLFSPRWEIGKYRYILFPASTDIIARAIDYEDYILKEYKEIIIYKEEDISMPKLEDILGEMVGSYSISEETESKFQSMMKEFLDKHKIKNTYPYSRRFELVEEYDIKPLIKSILEDRVSKIEENFNLFKRYKEKLDRM